VKLAMAGIGSLALALGACSRAPSKLVGPQTAPTVEESAARCRALADGSAQGPQAARVEVDVDSFYAAPYDAAGFHALTVSCGGEAWHGFVARAGAAATLFDWAIAHPRAPVEATLAAPSAAERDARLLRVESWRALDDAPSKTIDEAAATCRRLGADAPSFAGREQPLTAAVSLSDYYDAAHADRRDADWAFAVDCGGELLTAYGERARLRDLFDFVAGGRREGVALTLAVDASGSLTVRAWQRSAGAAGADALKRTLMAEGEKSERKRSLHRGLMQDPLGGWKEPPPANPRELAALLALALDRLRGDAFENRVSSLVRAAPKQVEPALTLLDEADVLGRVLGAAAARRRLLSEVLHTLRDHVLISRCTVALLRSGDRDAMARWIVGLNETGGLGDLFSTVIDSGQYEALATLLVRSGDATPALQALAQARPAYGGDLNAPTLSSMAARSDWDQYKYDFLIVPGFTPLRTLRPLTIAEIPVARQRLDLAIADFRDRKLAPYILVSGGAVHPSGTRNNEAIMMRDYLVQHGVPADRVLVDPFARHSTTNLRNAGRIMLAAHHTRAVIVTGFDGSTFDQAFYFSHPVLSTFNRRCQNELGYSVGALDGVDDHHISFRPAPEVTRPNYRDPLDV
jgi:hypothetical protein